MAKLRQELTGRFLTVMQGVFSDHGVAWMLTGPAVVSLVRQGSWDFVSESFVDVTDHHIQVALLFRSPADMHLKCT